MQDVVVIQGAVSEDVGSIALNEAGRSEPPPAGVLAVGGLVVWPCSSSLLEGIGRGFHPSSVIGMIVFPVDLPILYVEIFACFRIAEQEDLVLGVVTAVGVIYAIALALAVIHIGQENGALFLGREGFVQEVVV